MNLHIFFINFVQFELTFIQNELNLIKWHSVMIGKF